MSLKDQMNRQIHTTGESTGNTYTHLLFKRGHLRIPIGSSMDDIVGFNYIIHTPRGCYTYYEANPPLIGLTQPMPIQCPLGLAKIHGHHVDYKRALEIFQRTPYGKHFAGLSLSRPLYPGVNEPYWTILTPSGQTVIIGGNSGDILS